MKNKNRAFTLIELVIVVAIVAILSTVIMFSVAQYINRGKDSNVSGNLAVLIPSGEAYYNIENTYASSDGSGTFCTSGIVIYTHSQMSIPNPPVVCLSGLAGLCCKVATDGSSWMACAQEFTNPKLAYCVDSTGIKREICASSCIDNISKCPDPPTSDCP